MYQRLKSTIPKSIPSMVSAWNYKPQISAIWTLCDTFGFASYWANLKVRSLCLCDLFGPLMLGCPLAPKTGTFVLLFVAPGSGPKHTSGAWQKSECRRATPKPQCTLLSASAMNNFECDALQKPDNKVHWRLACKPTVPISSCHCLTGRRNSV